MRPTCPGCGADFEAPSLGARAEVETRCPSCGRRLSLRRAGSPGGESDASTLFQPGLLVELAESGVPTVATPPDPGRFVAPAAPPGIDAYFLVLGAAPGRERIGLALARTIFGGAGADVVLDGEPAGAQRFQVDVLGREVFLRSLDSARPALLNDRAAGYVQLLPGDEVRCGSTLLVFRTAGDGLARRG